MLPYNALNECLFPEGIEQLLHSSPWCPGHCQYPALPQSPQACMLFPGYKRLLLKISMKCNIKLQALHSILHNMANHTTPWGSLVFIEFCFLKETSHILLLFNKGTCVWGREWVCLVFCTVLYNSVPVGSSSPPGPRGSLEFFFNFALKLPIFPLHTYCWSLCLVYWPVCFSVNATYWGNM